jgi:non-ribosomal peptide synthetase component F
VRPSNPTYEAASVAVTLPPELFSGAPELAQRLKVNAQAVLLSVVEFVLMQYSGQDDIVVGVPAALFILSQSIGILFTF